MKEILKLKKKLKKATDKEEIKIYIQLAERYQINNKFELALEHYLKAHTLLNLHEKLTGKIKDHNNLLLTILLNIGKMYLIGNTDYEKSLSYNIKALKLAEKLDNNKLMQSALSGIGYVHRMLGNYKKSIEYFERSVVCAKKRDDKLTLINPYNELGNGYCYLEDYEKSLKYHQKALKIAEQEEYKLGISYISHDIGIVFFAQEKYEEALKNFLYSLKIQEEINDARGISIACLNIANVYNVRGNYQKALEYTEKSIEHAKRINNKSQLMEGYLALSEAYEGLNDFKQSLCFLRQHLDLKNKLFSDTSQKKIAELQTKYDSERKTREAQTAKQEAMIYKLKNVELAKAYEDNQKKTEEIEAHREHLRLINQILRHDLMNNLSVSISALKMFEDSFDKNLLKESKEAIIKSTELIKRMKELETFITSNQNLKFYDINKLIKELSLNYQNLEFNISGDCRVLADGAITSVIDNIIGNAVLHSNTAKIEISIEKKGKTCLVRLADNGVGIPDELKEKIFEERFCYGENAHSGLGLFIVKKTMERYGGSVFVEDNDPQGSIFVLMFKMLT